MMSSYCIILRNISYARCQYSKRDNHNAHDNDIIGCTYVHDIIVRTYSILA
jgi:hypothetical protein